MTALQVVYELGLKPIPVPEGVNLIHFAALMGSKKEGYMSALTNLRALAKVTPVKAPEPSPWADVSVPPEVFAPDATEPLPIELQPAAQPAQPVVTATPEPPQPKL